MYIIRGKGLKIKEPESGEKKCRVSFDFGGWGALRLFPFVIRDERKIKIIIKE